MNVFKQTFTTGSAKHALELCRTAGTFNRRKFGRHRRGTVMSLGATWQREDSGQWTVEVTFVTGIPRFISTPTGKRFPLYGFSDFQKALRKVAK